MAASDDSPADPLEAARALLQPDEQLVWADRPGGDAFVRSKLPNVIRGALGLAVIAGFLWFSFIPSWPGGGRGLLLAALLLAAVAYALWLLAAPVLARRGAADIIYAVTNRRLLIAERFPFRRVAAFAPSELDEPQVVEGRDGRGTVVFINHKKPWWQRSAGGSYRIEAFFGVAEAESVAAHIAQLRTPDAGPEDASGNDR